MAVACGDRTHPGGGNKNNNGNAIGPPVAVDDNNITNHNNDKSPSWRRIDRKRQRHRKRHRKRRGTLQPAGLHDGSPGARSDPILLRLSRRTDPVGPVVGIRQEPGALRGRQAGGPRGRRRNGRQRCIGRLLPRAGAGRPRGSLHPGSRKRARGTHAGKHRCLPGRPGTDPRRLSQAPEPGPGGFEGVEEGLSGVGNEREQREQRRRRRDPPLRRSSVQTTGRMEPVLPEPDVVGTMEVCFG
mmetsp:Transcript_101555/g.206216  ORF Transcript_101555/g.206216 Transcript_101555/m.206216 type:complete len:242 (-) Transcript_101555:4867-5592(-)